MEGQATRRGGQGHEDHRDRDDPARRVSQSLLGPRPYRRGAGRARRSVLRRQGRGRLRARERSPASARPGCARDRPPLAHAAGHLRRLLRQRRRDARPVGDRPRALGPVRPSHRPADPPAPGRPVAAEDPRLQHLRGLSLRAHQRRPADRELGAAEGAERGPLRGPRRLPQPRRRARAEPARAGHHGHEDLAVRLRGRGLGRNLHQRGGPQAGARALPQDPRRGRRSHRHHGRAAHALEPARRPSGSSTRSRSSSRSGSRIRSR